MGREERVPEKSYKQQAASTKPQATSAKRQAPSSKLKNIFERLLDPGPRISKREA